jgi:phosphatidylethanolamine-binding protein (PEBP) family uncharacterized protein
MAVSLLELSPAARAAAEPGFLSAARHTRCGGPPFLIHLEAGLHASLGQRHFVALALEVGTREEGAPGTAMPAGSREVKPYAGPFPPSGTHEYEFTLYGLETERLDLPKKLPPET